MARFNEILVGRFNRALQKLTAIKGEVPSPQLASEIMPVFPFPTGGAEFRYLEAWALFCRNANFGASAGNINAIRLRNPAGSNVIAVVHKIGYSTATAQDLAVSLGTATADFGATSAPPVDTRDGRAAGSTIFSTTQAAAPAALTGAFNIAVIKSAVAGQLFDIIVDPIQEIPILPGSALQLTDGTANLASSMGIWWRERFLEDMERT